MLPRMTDLVAQLAAAPGDLELRRVYADLLGDRGDPRGELITLQLLPSPDKTQRERIARLAAEHRATWLGPLAHLAEAHEYQGGFLSRLTVRGGVGWDAVLAPAFAHELATLVALSVGRGMPLEIARRLLEPGRFPLLETLSIPAELADEVRCASASLELRVKRESLDALRLVFDSVPAELAVVVDNEFAAAAGVVFRRAMSEALPPGTVRIAMRSSIDLELARDEVGDFSELDAQWHGAARPTLIPTLLEVLEALPTRRLTHVHIGANVDQDERDDIADLLPAGILTYDHFQDEV